MQHETAVGVETSRRRDYFGDYVYDFAGISNVFNPVAVPPSSKQPGPVSLRRMDKETALYLQDIISLNTEWKLHLNTRRVQLDRVQLDNPGYNQQHWVSGAALVYKPVASLTTYLSQSQGLEYGGIAPIDTTNANQMLNPLRSRQTEAGIKYSGDNQLQLSAAVFQITKPLELINANKTYVQTGEARHRGIELNAQGHLMKDLKVLASFTAIDAVQQDTGSAAYDGKQVLNVPGRKASITLDYSLPVAGLSVQGGWQYASEKAFSPDNRIMVPGYYVLNAGARYQTRISGVPTTFRAQIDNLTDRFYWRDVTQSLGGYLFPGAPRTVRLSAQLAF
jgi:iron complex outermembrane receptor protein